MSIRRRGTILGLVCAPICGLLCLTAPSRGWAQQSQPIGWVGVADATVAGALEVSNGRAVLVGASTVTAKDRTAEIQLSRGGAVRVCSTSGLHVTAGKGGVDAPLLLALDRGAIEVAARTTTSDVVMTPDLRFTMRSDGPLDLRLRVARNGDTCVENRGTTAPVLGVTDQFGEASYEVRPGQHLLFEHGSLKEVVDHESEPCGCPPVPVVSVADAGVTGAQAALPGAAVAKSAAAQHPFPAAESAGLAPVNGPPQAPPGEVHAQVSTSMSYGEGAGAVGQADGTGSSASTSSAAPAAGGVSSNAGGVNPAAATTNSAAVPQMSAQAESAGTAQAPPPPPAPPPGDVFHSIGRFFKRIFGGH